MELELKDLQRASDNNNVVEHGETLVVEMNPGNGACATDASDSTEVDSLLQNRQVGERNGRNNDVDDTERNKSRCERVLCRLKKELNEPAIWRLKVWMIYLILLVVVVAVLVLTVIICIVTYKDVDETYDASTFTVARVFRGNFTRSSQNFTTDMPSVPSREDIEQKLTDIYQSSHALGRYFCNATVLAMRNPDVEFEVTFLMPEEHENLVKYVLNRQFVSRVLRQNLLDEEPRDRFYIDVSSLRMKVGN